LFQMINVRNLLTKNLLAKLAIKLTWSESGGLFHLGRSSAAGISSEDWGRWSSETSPEQMLEYV